MTISCSVSVSVHLCVCVCVSLSLSTSLSISLSLPLSLSLSLSLSLPPLSPPSFTLFLPLFPLSFKQALNTRWYDARVEEPYRLPKPQGQNSASAQSDKEQDEGRLALLIGNTRAIWNPFLAFLVQNTEPSQASPPLLAEGQALNTYVMHQVEQAVEDCLPTALSPQIRFSHDLTPGLPIREHQWRETRATCCLLYPAFIPRTHTHTRTHTHAHFNAVSCFCFVCALVHL